MEALRMRILYNSKCREDKSPFGTLKVGESCSVSVRIPVSCKTVRAELVFLKEDHAPYASFVMELCESDELYERYRAVFALGREGLYFYYFRIQTENEAFSLYRQGFDQTNMESGDFWQLTCTPRSFS
ncbi:MAG: hypothetical protein IKD31_01780, partial [Clostridia bacterium]|nr:hypothetical protein [Clostridia bacterium]